MPAPVTLILSRKLIFPNEKMSLKDGLAQYAGAYPEFCVRGIVPMTRKDYAKEKND
jgi:hypothetical protein